MPSEITRYTRVLAWLNLIVNIGIVGTGGLVRLTGSGLGCPTWPLCTPESLVPTQEMGIHGAIEFGNRTLTGVLVVVALLSFLSVVRASPRYGLRGPAFTIGLLVIVQAIVGGVTVWLALDPRIVGVHFFISAAIVAVAAILLQRVRFSTPVPRGMRPTTEGGVWAAAVVTAVLAWITELVGVLTTGSGPHAGDSMAARNGLDPEIMHHVHAWPGYALVASIVVLLLLARRAGLPRAVSTTLWLGALVVVQIAFGVFQARTGLPVWSVAVHMILAVVIIGQLTMSLIGTRRELLQRDAKVAVEADLTIDELATAAR